MTTLTWQAGCAMHAECRAQRGILNESGTTGGLYVLITFCTITLHWGHTPWRPPFVTVQAVAEPEPAPRSAPPGDCLRTLFTAVRYVRSPIHGLPCAQGPQGVRLRGIDTSRARGFGSRLPQTSISTSGMSGESPWICI